MSYFPSDIPYMTDNELEEHGINAKRERVMSEHIGEAIDKTVHDKDVQNNKKFRASICEANVELTRLGSALRDYIEKQTADAYQRGVEDGRNETWEVAKKLSWTEKYGGYGECLDKIFNRTDIFDIFDYSPNEAIEKLREYEEKQKADDEIKVGDEVEIIGTGDKFFIVGYEDDCICGFAYGGKTCRVQPVFAQKTGRHIDIPKILNEMKE